MHIFSVLEALGGILGLGALISAVVIYGRVNGLQAAVTMFSAANAELRAQNVAGQTERSEMRAEFTEKLHTQELDCARQISRLEGQMNALTGGLADQILQAVTSAIKDRDSLHE